MEIMNWQEITMESETFSKIRESFNLLLQRLFQKMESMERMIQEWNWSMMMN